MQQNLRIVSLSDFRKNAPRLTDWIRQAEGRIWVTKHGKTVCGVVPLDQLEMIEKLEGRSRAEERERFARVYCTWKSQKALGMDTALDQNWQEFFEEVAAGRRGF